MLARDPHQPEGDEGNQNRHGDGDQGNDGAGDVPEKKQDHQGHGDHHLHQGGLQVADGPLDQVGAVVDRHDLDAGRQARLDLPDLGLDPVDDLQGVFSLAHDHDPGNHLPFPVQVGDPPPDVRPQGHFTDVLDPDRGAGLAGRQDDVFEILQGPGVAPAADHVFGAAEFDQPPAHLHVALAHRLGHPVDGEAIGLEPVGVNVHLVLLLETAHRGHLGHPGHRLQVETQIPVLAGNAGPPGCACRIVSTRAYWKTQPRPVASGPSSVLTPAGRSDRTPERYSRVRDRAQ